MTQNIAVIAANGKSGQLIVREAVDRGLDVTAVVRGENKTVAQHAIIKDLFDLTAADLAGFDVVVDAFGAWTPETFPQHSTSLKHLADVLSSADARLIVVGGAGSLYVNPEHTVQLSQTDGFPEAFLPLATAMGDSLAELRERSDVRWTYVSPAADFQADGPRTGKYVLAGEEFTANEAGESAISYADYAIAIVEAWKAFGTTMIIYLAGLQTVDESLLEAGRIDGCTEWQLFRKIKLPLISSTVTINIILSVISGLKAFDYSFIMTNGGPGKSTKTLMFQVYETAFTDMKMGRASAFSVLAFAFIIVITVCMLLYMNKREVEL